MSTLHDAARGDDPDAVAAVLAQGLVDVNTRDKLSRTPLIIASWAGKVSRTLPQTRSHPPIQISARSTSSSTASTT